MPVITKPATPRIREFALSGLALGKIRGAKWRVDAPMMTSALSIVGLISLASLFGSMLFFSAVVAPLVFTRLEAAVAGSFIRGIFPWYYLVILSLAGTAAISYAALDPLAAWIMGVVALGALVSRQILMPRINRLRDRALEGDARADRQFAWLHRLSVWINLAQMVGALAILVRLAMA